MIIGLIIIGSIVASIPIGISITRMLMCDNSQSYEEEVNDVKYQRLDFPYKVFETKEKGYW